MNPTDLFGVVSSNGFPRERVCGSAPPPAAGTAQALTGWQRVRVPPERPLHPALQDPPPADAWGRGDRSISGERPSTRANGLPASRENAGHHVCARSELLLGPAPDAHLYPEVLQKCKPPHIPPLHDAGLWARRGSSTAPLRSIPAGSRIVPCSPWHPDPGSTREPGSPGDPGLCGRAAAQT